MQPEIQVILGYTTIPAIAILLGGGIAVFHNPGPKARSIVQHFAAGVVFAAVAAELLPAMTRDQHLPPLIVGFLCGVGVMLIVSWLVDRLESGPDRKGGRSPTGLLLGVAIDVFVDGLLLGASFAAGRETGVLITLALTLELVFLGLSTSAALGRAGKKARYALTILLTLALLLFGGTTVGGSLLAGLSGDPLVGVLAFATAALLYLVTEELLVEAHDIADTALATAMFFMGFLALLVIDISFR